MFTVHILGDMQEVCQTNENNNENINENENENEN